MTRSEAVTILRNEQPHCGDKIAFSEAEKYEALNMAIEALEQDRPKWIPVSERLPEIQNYSDNYLVTLKRGGVHIAMFTECDGKHWWTYDDVEAWMPLPEPYKEREEEE